MMLVSAGVTARVRVLPHIKKEVPDTAIERPLGGVELLVWSVRYFGGVALLVGGVALLVGGLSPCLVPRFS